MIIINYNEWKLLGVRSIRAEDLDREWKRSRQVSVIMGSKIELWGDDAELVMTLDGLEVL